MTLSLEDIARIRAGAEKASPGPWHEGDKWVFVPPRDGNPSSALEHIFRNEEAQANAAFVALANPATVSALCDMAMEREGLRAGLDQTVAAIVAAQAVLASFISPDGISAEDAINALLGILDRRDLVVAVRQLQGDSHGHA